MQLTEFEQTILNELTYKILKAEDDRQMRMDCLNNIRLLIPFDMGFFCLTDVLSGENILRDGVACGFTQEEMDHYLQMYIAQPNRVWLTAVSESRAFRVSDFLSREAKERFAFYENSEKIYGLEYAIRMVLVHNDIQVGFLSIFRSKNAEDFNDRDIFILDTIKKHMAFYLYKNVFLAGQSAKPTVDLNRTAAAYGLTPREKEIMELLFKGERNEDIAEELCIALNTEKKHVLNIYKKLRISNRVDLMKLLME